MAEDEACAAVMKLPLNSSEHDSLDSVRRCCQTKNIPLDAASPVELTLFKSCKAIASTVSRVSVLTGKNTIELLKLYGRPNQAESLRIKLERIGDPSLLGNAYTPSPDAETDHGGIDHDRATEPKHGKAAIAADHGEDDPAADAKRVRKRPKRWVEEDDEPAPLRRPHEDAPRDERLVSLDFGGRGVCVENDEKKHNSLGCVTTLPAHARLSQPPLGQTLRGGLTQSSPTQAALTQALHGQGGQRLSSLGVTHPLCLPHRSGAGYMGLTATQSPTATL